MSQPPLSPEMQTEDSFFQLLRNKEYKRLDEQKQCYLDFTGGNLYPESLLVKHFDYLKSNVYGNPHSGNPTSLRSTVNIEATRKRVLDFFNGEDYVCVFTANASAALKIVGECYPFNADSKFLYTVDNHNSVNGIREFCKAKKGTVRYSLLNVEDLSFNKESLETELNATEGFTNKLFAYPAQSNVSGVKHDLGWIQYAHNRGWDVLLDAAAFVPSSKLDLKEIQPDFVSISFYKIFGYPTGLGCLLIKKEKFEKLEKSWFAGGTVTWVSILNDSFTLANNHEKFENGTLNYLDIPALSLGLDFIETIGIDRINQRVKHLTQYAIEQLEPLEYDNGINIVKLYACKDLEHKGGTIIFNIHDSSGNIIPTDKIEHLANIENISLRTGCFCNPGLDEINNCITNSDLVHYFTSKGNYEYYDMITFLGKMRGAVRVSFGLATVKEDIDHLVQFIIKLKEMEMDGIVSDDDLIMK
ncbi:MAG TPA: aminotransferase class V-fold PLP-dependent enzyme [Edaphocola sp.]|nr:aminotransferase class V-fold PLP-dependent enzyme [Edaphocola sp.]